MLFVGSLSALSQQAAAQQGAKSLVFKGVTVIDVESGRLVADRTVAVVGNRVQAIGAAGKVDVPRDAQVVEAQGKFLMPGLWDMHAHVRHAPDKLFPLFIATGVTGIRDMDRPVGPMLPPYTLDTMFQWRREILAGARVGPRVVATGAMIETDGDGSDEPYVTKVRSVEEGRAAVRELKDAGAEFVKVHSEQLPRDVYFAIAAEARRLAIPFVGHVPEAVTLVEASDSGQHSIEHVNEFASPCITPATGYVRQVEPVSDQACAELAARFIRNDTWFTPTLTVFSMYAGRQDVFSHYLPAVSNPFAGQESTLEWIVDDGKRLVGAVHRAGLPLLAGTDVGLNAAASIHTELALLVEAGLKPLDAIRTATLNPAKFFHATDSLGTVAPGKLADLLLLDADPLADIANTAKIQAVVANGRYYDRAALDSLLNGLKSD